MVLFLPAVFRMCFNYEVLKGMFPWRTRYPFSRCRSRMLRYTWPVVGRDPAARSQCGVRSPCTLLPVCSSVIQCYHYDADTIILQESWDQCRARPPSRDLPRTETSGSSPAHPAKKRDAAEPLSYSDMLCNATCFALHVVCYSKTDSGTLAGGRDRDPTNRGSGATVRTQQDSWLIVHGGNPLKSLLIRTIGY